MGPRAGSQTGGHTGTCHSPVNPPESTGQSACIANWATWQLEGTLRSYFVSFCLSDRVTSGSSCLCSALLIVWGHCTQFWAGLIWPTGGCAPGAWRHLWDPAVATQKCREASAPRGHPDDSPKGERLLSFELQLDNSPGLWEGQGPSSSCPQRGRPQQSTLVLAPPSLPPASWEPSGTGPDTGPQANKYILCDTQTLPPNPHQTFAQLLIECFL